MDANMETGRRCTKTSFWITGDPRNVRFIQQGLFIVCVFYYVSVLHCTMDSTAAILNQCAAVQHWASDHHVVGHGSDGRLLTNGWISFFLLTYSFNISIILSFCVNSCMHLETWSSKIFLTIIGGYKKAQEHLLYTIMKEKYYLTNARHTNMFFCE